MEKQFSVLGKSVTRKDAVEKVKGNHRYIADISFPNMLHLKFLRCPHPHAKITHIDTSKAMAIPGVKCVLTHENVPKLHPMRKLEWLMGETVYFPGAEVAVVAALTPEIAQEALGLIDVQYEILPAILDPEKAIEPDSDLAHPEYGHCIYKGTDVVHIPRLDEDGWLKLGFGNIEEGFKNADEILEFEFETPMQYNCSPMPRSVVCDWNGDHLTCWADTQLPLFLWRDLSHSFHIPQSKIRVIAQGAVGGYGGKSPEKTATLAALVAKRTGRPARAVFSRAEDFIGTHHRISYKTGHKIGVKKDGTITAIYTNILANWGSDTVAHYVCQSSAVLDSCNMFYRWENALAETRGVLTNMLGYGPMNGFGDPEAIYSIEMLMDNVCEKIKMDPVEFRLKNCMRYGDRAMEYEQVLNGPIEWGILGPDMDSFPAIIKKCADQFNWKNKWTGWKTDSDIRVDGEKKKGVGMAIGMHHTCFWPSSAIVKMNQDGSANVLTGAVEIGQGYATATAQVVAEALGIRYEDVHVICADTATTPATTGNVASTGTSSPMNACKLAADHAKSQILELAAKRLDTTPDKLEIKDRIIQVPGTSKAVTIADICFNNWQITGIGKNPPYHAIRDEKTGKVIHAYAAACTFCEVEVDTGTGKVILLKVISGHDTGRTINPVIVDNQIDLGLIMAAGWTLTEEYIVDPKTGVMMNPNLLDYKLLGFKDIPSAANFEKIVVEKPCAWGPFGAKGMSETAMTALGPAIANAIYDATGVRMTCSFFSPANVLKALQQAKMEV